MILGPVTKLKKRNMTTSKKFGEGIMTSFSFFHLWSMCRLLVAGLRVHGL